MALRNELATLVEETCKKIRIFIEEMVHYWPTVGPGHLGLKFCYYKDLDRSYLPIKFGIHLKILAYAPRFQSVKVYYFVFSGFIVYFFS